jgi:hypothetical protein
MTHGNPGSYTMDKVIRMLSDNAQPRPFAILNIAETGRPAATAKGP